MLRARTDPDGGNGSQTPNIANDPTGGRLDLDPGEGGPQYYRVPPPQSELNMPWNDEAVVEGLKQREPQAIQYTVETYAPKLYRYAIYQLGEHQAAEDLVSEVITRMLEKIDAYKPTGAPFQAWLFSIARNLVADSYRRRKRAQVISLDAQLQNEAGEIQRLGAIDAHLDGLADRDALVRSMRRLTEEQRQILMLRVVEGWETGEIAGFLGRSIDSVKSLQYRALQAMKRSLERERRADAADDSVWGDEASK